MSLDILILDDDRSLGEMLAMHFDDKSLKARCITTCKEALPVLEQEKPRLLILDQHLPDMLGLSFLKSLKEKGFTTPVIMMTGKHDMQLAIDVIRNGALDYVHKPLNLNDLDSAVKRALSHAEASAHLLPKKNSAPDDEPERPNIIGSSKAILNILKTIALASQSDATVLIEGESGTGKDLVAQAIHYYSGKNGAFVGINCAALVENLLESELFGHEKGAFTGASSTKEGLFEAAEKGTLFLDEIGETSLNLQAKLLRILQEKKFQRVGSTQEMKTNARIIVATNRSLQRMVAEKTFREDLYYRLNVIHLYVPPLRERMEDLRLLVPFLLGKITKNLGKDTAGLTDEAYHLIMSHSWPGNIRELENVLTRALAVTQSPHIGVNDLNIVAQPLSDARPSTAAPASPLSSLEDVEAAHIKRVLADTQGHKGNACAVLGISRPALERKLKKYAITVSDYKA